MAIRAILFGATGMVGEGVLHEALKHPEVEAVLVIGRRSCGVSHPKLTEILHQHFYDYSTVEDRLKGINACFFCLGVTSIGKREEEYNHLTYDLTMAVAKTLSRLNPEMTFCYVSGAGTDSTEMGRVMWARVKGKTENHLSKLPFKSVYLFRPGFIKPIPGLHHAYAASRALAWIYPLLLLILPNYVCTLEEVGLSMIRVAGPGYPRRILENRDIRDCAQSGSKSSTQ
jgi:uncharacterized protein YbjT (DUF2867 family)